MFFAQMYEPESMEKSGQIKIEKLIQVFGKAAMEVDVNYKKK